MRAETWKIKNNVASDIRSKQGSCIEVFDSGTEMYKHVNLLLKCQSPSFTCFKNNWVQNNFIKLKKCIFFPYISNNKINKNLSKV